jgi:hypothetical protein
MIQKARNSLNHLSHFFNTHTSLVVTILSIFPLLPLLSLLIKPQAMHWYEIHGNFFLLLLVILTTFTISAKVSPARLMLALLIDIVLVVLDLPSSFADIFFYHWFSHSFPDLQAKDEKVIIFVCYIVLFIINIALIVYQKIKYNRYVLNRIFLTLSSGAIIVTTIIFHLYIIENVYHKMTNHSMVEMAQVIHTSQNHEFIDFCAIKGYQCYEGEEKNLLNHISLSSNLKELIQINLLDKKENPVIVANLMTSGNNDDFDKKEMIYILKLNQRWVINVSDFKNNFDYAQAIFFSLMTLAHGVWYYLTLFLLLFHNRRLYQKTQNFSVLKKSV